MLTDLLCTLMLISIATHKGTKAMTRTELKALPLKEQIMWRASGDLGFVPTVNAHHAAVRELMAEGKLTLCPPRQNSTTWRFRAAT